MIKHRLRYSHFLLFEQRVLSYYLRTLNSSKYQLKVTTWLYKTAHRLVVLSSNDTPNFAQVRLLMGSCWGFHTEGASDALFRYTHVAISTNAANAQLPENKKAYEGEMDS